MILLTAGSILLARHLGQRLFEMLHFFSYKRKKYIYVYILLEGAAFAHHNGWARLERTEIF